MKRSQHRHQARRQLRRARLRNWSLAATALKLRGLPGRKIAYVDPRREPGELVHDFRGERVEIGGGDTVTLGRLWAGGYADVERRVLGFARTEPFTVVRESWLRQRQRVAADVERITREAGAEIIGDEAIYPGVNPKK